MLTHAARSALERRKASSPVGLEQDKPEVLWAALAGDDARKAYRAMQALARQPKDSAAFLREKLRPLAAQEMLDDDPRRIAQLIADLDATAFARRQQASKGLERLGKRAEPLIRKAINAAPSLEVRKRLEEILTNLAGPKVSPERLQAERALEVLERIGGDEARQALEDLTAKAKNAWMQDALGAALARVKRGS